MTIAFRHAWFLSCVTAWWNAWLWFWGGISDYFDPKYQRDVRSQEINWNFPIGGGLDGGNFEGAGTGGQD